MRIVPASLCLLGAFTFVSLVLAQDDPKTRAKSAAMGALSQYGTSEGLRQNAMEPLSAGTPLRTGTGKTFTAQVSCLGSQRFLHLAMIPSGTNDIQALAVDLDANFDGVAETTRSFGPSISAVCNNGFVQCGPGTTTGCAYQKWRYTSAGLGVTPVAQGKLGACYCINNSCGANLLLTNSRKVLEDLGTGITAAMQTTVPKLGIAKVQADDVLNMTFFGALQSCGGGGTPEGYYGNPAGMSADGQALRDSPSFTMQALVESPSYSSSGTTQGTCNVTRTITTSQADVPNVIDVEALPMGTVESCGDRCMRVTLGQRGNNYYLNLGHCGYKEQAGTLRVNRPDLVSAVRLIEVGMDDWLRVRVEGSIVYNADPAWTAPGSRCGDYDDRGTKAVSIDVTSAFHDVAPGSSVHLQNELSLDDDGEAWSVFEFRFDQGCQLETESIDNGCAGLEADSGCQLVRESVDGVRTVDNYYRTGLTPLPSSKDYVSGSCTVSLTRDWHQKSRTYTCKTGTSPYDASVGVERWQSIHSTLDPNSGAFTDKTRDPDTGNWSTHSSSVALPSPQAEPGRAPVCKTRRPRPGSAMGADGAVSTLNATGVAWDYTYRECTDSTTCPVQPDETIVSDCNTGSNFAEAAAMMQTIRMAGQDLVCTAP